MSFKYSQEHLLIASEKKNLLLSGNKILSQLFVPYWFRSDTSLMLNMCWINFLTDETHY
jgi:hypothetical protein